MTTISLQVNDDIIKAYGIDAIQERLQRFLEWEQLFLSAKSIQEAVKESGEDNDQLWKEARGEAWKEFKEKQLKNILP